MSFVKLSELIHYGIHPSIVSPSINIDYIIDLTEEKENIDKIVLNDTNTKVIKFPIKDKTSSGKKNVLKIIKNILEILNQNKKIYICCKGGHGRSGMIACCIYGIKYNLNGKDALLKINNEWKQQRDMNYLSNKIKKLGSPQTKIQHNMVYKILDNN